LEEHEGDGKKTLTQLSQKYNVRMSEGLRDRIRNVSAYWEASPYISASTPTGIYPSPYFQSSRHIVAACTDFGLM